MKNKLIKIVLFLILFIGIISVGNVQAVSIPELKIVDYSDEYKEYMTLSDKEKIQKLEPSKYDVITPETNSEYIGGLNNIFKSAKLVKSSLNQKYDLRDIISQNLTIKNQMNTNACWAFATIGMLESNIALLDYKAGRTNNIYDYSERHIDYSVRSNAFNNGATNEYGYNIGFDKGGSFLMGQSYLTNGMGAIDEDEMPFENNEDNIDITEIQNKNTTTTLYDTILFENIEDIGKAELMSKMKQVISNYGGIYAIFHGAQLISDSYNNITGAIYCSEESGYSSDHSAVIIGWDDTYSKSNFKEGNQPTNDGAWIIKNSWGDTQTYSLTEIKEELYQAAKEEFNRYEINSPEDIPNEFIIEIFETNFGTGKVSIEGNDIIVSIGDKGYMYVSYEDANIYDELYAIEKATSTKDYDNIYQNNLLHAGLPVQMDTSDDLYIANKFTRDASSDNEVLTMVSIFTMQEVTCKVYVNPASSDLTNLQQVELESGETATIEPGYHTIILAEPVNLTGDSFAVAMSLQSGTDTQSFMVESQKVDTNAKANPNESFYSAGSAFDADVWIDLCSEQAGNINGNVSIKAFTEEQTTTPVQLASIEISNPPTNTTYTEGDNFDTTGMTVLAKYSDLSSKEITNYQVLDGDNLAFGQETVIISYTENGVTKEVKQAIIVNQLVTEKEIKSIEVKHLPTKTTYMENEELDLAGGVIQINYTDNTNSELNMNSNSLTITGFNNQNIGTQTITVQYQEFTTIFEVEVIEGVKPILSDFSDVEVTITDASVYLFQEIIEDDYIDMDIEISNIKDRDQKTDYIYYYYLSENSSEENIENWTKISNADITEKQDGTYTMSVRINTKDVVELEDLSNADNLYLYIREVGTASGESIEQVNVNQLDVNKENVIYYIDNEIKGNVDEVIDNDNPIITPDDDDSGDTILPDTTISPNPIPQTGVVYVGVLAIALVAGLSIYFFIRNRNIEK